VKWLRWVQEFAGLLPQAQSQCSPCRPIPTVAQLTLETPLALWATAAQKGCVWSEQWKREAAEATLDAMSEASGLLLY